MFESLDAPKLVLNIKLNCLTSVQFEVPETGHLISNSLIKFSISFRLFFLRPSTILSLVDLILVFNSRTL